MNLVKIKNQQAFITTRDVAELFGKDHRKVMSKLRSQLSYYSEDWLAANFSRMQIQVPTSNGGHRTDEIYELSRDGFAVLAMSFTGKKAARLREQVMTAFSAMEARLSKPSLPAGGGLEAFRAILTAMEEMTSRVAGLEVLTGQVEDLVEIDSDSILTSSQMTSLEAHMRGRAAQLGLTQPETFRAVSKMKRAVKEMSFGKGNCSSRTFKEIPRTDFDRAIELVEGWNE